MIYGTDKDKPNVIRIGIERSKNTNFKLMLRIPPRYTQKNKAIGKTQNMKEIS